MSQAFGATPTDPTDAIAAARTIVVGFAWLAFITPGSRRTALSVLANSVYAQVGASALLIAKTLADANRYARAQVADRILGAVGVLSALGSLTRALQTSGPLRAVRMFLTGSGQAVRISAHIVARTLSGLQAVPEALTIEAGHVFRARKVANFWPFATPIDAGFALGAL
jgi:hypothetical protein